MSKSTCILLLTDNYVYSDLIEDYAKLLYDVKGVFFGKQDDKNGQLNDINARVEGNNIDFLFNFLCPIILPEYILKQIKIASINIHPASPKYPGVGACSRALYNGNTMFGVTAHIIDKKIDSGKILDVHRFEIYDNDTCETIDIRARTHSVTLMHEILSKCASGQPIDKLFSCQEQWQGEYMSKKNFQEFMKIKDTDDEIQIALKIKALKHSKLPGPFIEYKGNKFGYIHQNE